MTQLHIVEPLMCKMFNFHVLLE